MQQSSATPKKSRCREGVAEDCCMLSILLAVPSCTYSFWHGVIPTSYFIFNDFYTCFTIFYAGLALYRESTRTPYPRTNAHAYYARELIRSRASYPVSNGSYDVTTCNRKF